MAFGLPFGLLLPLRIAQGAFALLTLALSAYVHHCVKIDGDTQTDVNSQNSFIIFVSIFSFLSVLYIELMTRLKSKAAHPHAHLIIEFLNIVFTFSGFIALAKGLSTATVCKGAPCDAARAEDVFTCFNWILWTGTTIIALVELFKRGCCGSKARKQQNAAIKETQLNNIV